MIKAGSLQHRSSEGRGHQSLAATADDTFLLMADKAAVLLRTATSACTLRTQAFRAARTCLRLDTLLETANDTVTVAMDNASGRQPYLASAKLIRRCNTTNLVVTRYYC